MNGQKAFHELVELNPKYIVPDHGRISDLTRVKKDYGDYYDFLLEKIGSVAKEMEPIQDVMEQYNNLPQFKHLEYYGTIHPTNTNRTYLEYERL